MSTETATEPTKNNTASDALRAAQKETEKTAPTKPAPGKPGGKPKKAAKADKPAAEEKPAEPEGPKVTLNPFKLPAPKLVTVERKKIEKDKRLQHRSQLQDLKEGGAAEQYADAMREAKAAGKPNPFPPVKIVQDVADGTLWMYDGFQRIGAYEICRIPEVEAEVIPGTFADALMLSLGSNGENSVLPRTKDDARRSVFCLLDNPQLLAWALSKSKGGGGVHRVFAEICKTSTGTVANALTQRGLKPKGDKLVTATATKPKAKPQGKPQGKPEVSEAAQRKLDAEAYEKMSELPGERLVAEAIKAAKRLGAIFSVFATDDEISTEVRTAFSDAGFPLKPGFDKEAAAEGKSFTPYYAVLEHWPVVASLVSAWEKVAEAVKPKPEPEADKDAGK